MKTDLLAAALRLAGRNVPVFPCDPDKRPLVEHGFKAATTESDAIHRFWMRWPTAFIGVPTGDASGLVVVDLDTKNGKNGIAAFEALRAGRELPPHPLVRTQSDGRHMYFATAPGRAIRCSTSRLAPGVDVRAEGGYVVVPPSPGYMVEQRAPLVPPPPRLLDLLDPPPPRSESYCAPVAPDDAAARRLLGLVGLVAAAAEGERNAILYWAACRAAEAGLPERSAAIAFEEAACEAGLELAEARRTIASARRRAVA